MAGLLVPVVFALAALAVVAGRDRLGFGHTVREAVLAAGTLCGGFVWATVELLSPFHAVSKWPVRGCWIGAAVVLAAVVWRNRNELRDYPPVVQWPGALSALYATLCLGVLGWTGLTAALVPATNIDGLLYHQPRQLQWLQAGSVAHFPTQDYRLTVNPPFAEFCGLTFDALTGRDCWVNVPQWAAFGLTLVAVSLTVRELGAPRSGQWLAAALAATLPIAVQQAASPKNDVTAGCWSAAAGFWAVRVWSAKRVTWFESVLAGLSVGLLLLTKGTGVAFAAPIMILAGVGLVVRRPEGWISGMAYTAALALLVPLGHWVRNVYSYGTVSGQTFGLPVDPIGVGPTASNLVRNLSGQLSSPDDAWNAGIVSAVTQFHTLLSLPLNNPETTWQATLGFILVFDPTSWEEATAPVHWLLAAVTVVVLPLAATGPYRAARVVSVLSAVGALVAFCAAFKWQPSNARLLLPVEVMFAAPAAVALSLPMLRWLGPPAVVVAALLLSPILIGQAEQLPGVGRPWADRWTPEARYGPYTDAARLGRLAAGRVQLLKPRSVGLINNAACGWEYPVARTIREWVTPPPRISYFYPTPEQPEGAPPPDVVIDFSGGDSPNVIRHPDTGRPYRVSDRIGPFTIYQPSSEHTEPEPPSLAVARFGVRIDYVPQTVPVR